MAGQIWMFVPMVTSYVDTGMIDGAKGTAIFIYKVQQPTVKLVLVRNWLRHRRQNVFLQTDIETRHWHYVTKAHLLIGIEFDEVLFCIFAVCHCALSKVRKLFAMSCQSIREGEETNLLYILS